MVSADDAGAAIEMGIATSMIMSLPAGHCRRDGRVRWPIAAAFTLARFGGRVARLCVRLPTSLPGFSPRWSLPSARLVSFDGFISTMNQSDPRPQLGRRLRVFLAALPRWRPIQRFRSGLSCSDDHLPYVAWPSTPAERHRLA